MLFAVGDIWAFAPMPIVIPTNVGWTKDGSNVMGGGLAKQAADKYPDLPKWYGKICKDQGRESRVVYYPPANLIMFPTKSLNSKEPHLSWKNPATLNMIHRSTVQLEKLATEMKFPNVAVPLVGCGLGGLPHQIVVPILSHYLDGRFGLVLDQDNANILQPGK